MKSKLTKLALMCLSATYIQAAQPAGHLLFEGGDGPGKGKHLVLISGDEEYRSEESMPMLGQMLAKHHGFKCTVLFSLDDKGIVDPNNQKSLSHPEALESADLIVMCIRFRGWDDAAMEKFDAAYKRGVPMVTLRTTNHGFKFPGNSKWAKYSFNAKKETGWKGGFGMHLFGMTWVAHHGKHKVQGCRGIVEEANKDSEILNGVGTIFVESDVYAAKPPADFTVLLRGEVTESLKSDSKPVEAKNKPMQPVAWTVLHKNESGKTNRIFNTTMGAASDLDDENLRRLVTNACFWGLNIDVPAKANVSIPESYAPTFYGFKTFKKGLKPVDFVLKP